ncbi:hypothetical protein THII_2883 [Thioploca ingrica]|uniref:Glycosyltransferase RgtA/B/C/D-like domain-containing protein n=1 Tax=Thioploca ingrica TaxID=40754 RepID=A0A090ANX7_9GAMM|nr:hypothetical protein THII_2883 [Thioploca ingrica]
MVIYVTLHNYNPYRVDDTWFASFIYNDYVKNIQVDTVFGGEVTHGMGGTQLFGKFYTLTYGSIIDLFLGDWTKANFYTITIGLLILTSFIWYFILLKLGISKIYAIYYVLLILYSYTFFVAAHSVRPEIFILFWTSLSLLATLFKKYTLSILFAFIAIETHPIGSISLFINLAVLLEKNYQEDIIKNWQRILLKVTLALLISLSVYLYFHYDYLYKITAIKAASQPFLDVFIYKYYFLSTYYRTFPELVLILISVYFYISKGLYKTNSILLHLFIAVIIFSLLIGRGNVAYAVLLYPIFWLLIFSLFIHINQFSLLIALTIVFYLPQYAFLYYRSFHYADYGKSYRSFLLANVPQDNLPVVGFPNDYWSFIDKRDFYHVCYFNPAFFQQNIRMAWLIEPDLVEFDRFFKHDECDNLQNITANYSKQLVKTIYYANKPIKLYKITRKF